MRVILVLLVLFGTLVITNGPAQAAEAPFDVNAAVQSYLDTLTPEEKARSDAYFEGGYWIELWDLVYGLVVALILLHFRLSARLRDWNERIFRRRWLATMGYGAGYVLAIAILGFPWTVYVAFVREHQYDLSTQTFGAWFGEHLMSLGFALVGAAIAVLVLYAVIRRLPRTWYLWGAAAMIGLMGLAVFVSPVFIEPAFNDYTPMQEGPLRDDILAMARMNGVPADDVFVVDASRQTTRISANVAGLFGTTRIALNDNLLNQGTPAEVKAVMGHELGHYVLGHAYRFMTSFAILIAIGFAFVHWAFGRVIARHGTRWDVRGLDDVAGLPLIIALLSIYFFAITPLTNTITRTSEAEADIFGLNVAHEPDGFASIAMKLSTYRKIAPGPLEEAVFYDHPSGKSRVTMAMRWKAENLELLEALAAREGDEDRTP
ncbi:MAG: M48 family metallopeptidase [Rhodothalassiaceae bacterium]